MTKEEARIVWAAASEYRWRGFDHWWAEQPSNKPETTEWIKPSERLPEDNQVILVMLQGNFITNAEFRHKETSGYLHVQTGDPKHMWWRNNCGSGFTVSCEPTHWQPLPKGPKEGKE